MLVLYNEVVNYNSYKCFYDIKRTPWSNLMLFCVLKALHNEGLISVDQLIYEYDTNCCHVGYKAAGNREQVLIRKSINGNLVYGSV